MTWGRPLVIALGSAVVLSAPVGPAPTAWAAAAPEVDAEAVARQHYQRGELHYSASHFVEALAEYQAGYDAVPLPGFLVNIAQCQRRLGDLARARVTYQKFVLVAPDSPLVPEVRSLIRELDKLLAGAPAGPAGAPSRGSGHPVALALGGGAELGGGAVRADGSTPPGVQLVSPLSSSSSSRDTGEPRASSPSRWWFWGSLAAVTLAGTVAIIALGPGGANTVHDGTLGTLRR
jgi:tetratricopeptide (TPR) repeat protein